jgi:hypothetical protein
LPLGPHAAGLRAVQSHIAAAIRHFDRGQKEVDDTLFTDVIFRCNQAFEGSIKEAYRVLAGKDPKAKTPNDIEIFLTDGNILRKKVLDQFTIYRREWRNPSTHDYTLDFDEDEALMAIVSVSAFAIVLCDQIDGKLAFNEAAAVPAPRVSTISQNVDLLELVGNKIVSFVNSHKIAQVTEDAANPYYRFEGALSGYLASELANLNAVSVNQDVIFMNKETDILVGRSASNIVIDIKFGSSKDGIRRLVENALSRASQYMQGPHVTGVIIVIYTQAEDQYAVHLLAENQAPVRIVVPKSFETLLERYRSV